VERNQDTTSQRVSNSQSSETNQDSPKRVKSSTINHDQCSHHDHDHGHSHGVKGLTHSSIVIAEAKKEEIKVVTPELNKTLKNGSFKRAQVVELKVGNQSFQAVVNLAVNKPGLTQAGGFIPSADGNTAGGFALSYNTNAKAGNQIHGFIKFPEEKKVWTLKSVNGQASWVPTRWDSFICSGRRPEQAKAPLKENDDIRLMTLDQYIDHLNNRPGGGGGGGAGGGTFTTRDDVPILNSLPSATSTLYLDFDGESVQDVRWNNGAVINANAYDGTPDDITAIFEQVAEDYRPFNMNVTTDKALYDSAPAESRMRAIITTSAATWTGAGDGLYGIALLDSFGDGLGSPSWMFSANVDQTIKIKSMAETISHEVGHTVGLEHDGHDGSGPGVEEAYYNGFGTGESSWAPIMGWSDYKNVTTWDNGAYQGATNPQDDLPVMLATGNFGYRPDDHGDIKDTTATLLETTGKNGVIEKATDIDTFKINLPVGTATLKIDPVVTANPNLDIRAELFDSTGTSVASSAPTKELSAEITFDVTTAGVYYLVIDGDGDTTTPYTDYCSLGEYKIDYSTTGIVVTPPTTPPTSGTPVATVIIRNDDGSNQVFTQDDAGTLTNTNNLINITDTDWVIAGRGDFNGNGQSDILWRHSGTGQNSIWFMQADQLVSGEFLPEIPDQGWKITAVGDFNADGKSDIVWRHSSTGENAIWLMNGSTILDSGFITPIADLGWEIQAAADFNGDNKADILWRHSVTGKSSLWFIDGINLVSTDFFVDVLSADWEVATTGDFDGDDKTDIFWVNKTNGQSKVHFRDGLTLITELDVTIAQSLNQYYVYQVTDFNSDGVDDLILKSYLGNTILTLKTTTDATSVTFSAP